MTTAKGKLSCKGSPSGKAKTPKNKTGAGSGKACKRSDLKSRGKACESSMCGTGGGGKGTSTKLKLYSSSHSKLKLHSASQSKLKHHNAQERARPDVTGHLPSKKPKLSPSSLLKGMARLAQTNESAEQQPSSNKARNCRKERPPAYRKIKRNIYMIPRPRLSPEEGIDCQCPQGATCTASCLCALLSASCTSRCSCGSKCRNHPFDQEKKIEVVTTGACGWGAIAGEDIKAGEFVVEYMGEVLDDAMCEERMWCQKQEGATDFYMCEISRDLVIDARHKGNLSRFINHGCEPNCEMKKWDVNGETRIGIFASEDICKGDTLTYDYQFVEFGTGHVCCCGAPKCRGFLTKTTRKAKKSAAAAATASLSGQGSLTKPSAKKAEAKAPLKVKAPGQKKPGQKAKLPPSHTKSVTSRRAPAMASTKSASKQSIASSIPSTSPSKPSISPSKRSTSQSRPSMPPSRASMSPSNGSVKPPLKPSIRMLKPSTKSPSGPSIPPSKQSSFPAGTSVPPARPSTSAAQSGWLSPSKSGGMITASTVTSASEEVSGVPRTPEVISVKRAGTGKVVSSSQKGTPEGDRNGAVKVVGDRRGPVTRREGKGRKLDLGMGPGCLALKSPEAGAKTLGQEDNPIVVEPSLDGAADSDGSVVEVEVASGKVTEFSSLNGKVPEPSGLDRQAAESSGLDCKTVEAGSLEREVSHLEHVSAKPQGGRQACINRYNTDTVWGPDTPAKSPPVTQRGGSGDASSPCRVSERVRRRTEVVEDRLSGGVTGGAEVVGGRKGKLVDPTPEEAANTDAPEGRGIQQVWEWVERLARRNFLRDGLAKGPAVNSAAVNSAAAGAGGAHQYQLTPTKAALGDEEEGIGAIVNEVCSKGRARNGNVELCPKGVAANARLANAGGAGSLSKGWVMGLDTKRKREGVVTHALAMQLRPRRNRFGELMGKRARKVPVRYLEEWTPLLPDGGVLVGRGGTLL